MRRKIADLVRIGWAAQDGTNLHFTMQAWEELTAIRRKRERLAVTYYEIIRQGIGDPPSHSD